MKLKYLIMLIVILTLVGYQFNAFSQTISELEYLSEGADLILTGKVTQQSSEWNVDKTRIYTNATIQVEDYLKGNINEASIVVTYLGGEVGDVGELYTHMPKFEDDEEILVFLQRSQSTSTYKVFNGEDGKLSIVYDKNTGEQVTASNVQINSLKLQIKNFTKEQ
ncbi:MAG: hypothetical protein DRQ13_07970 [Ignavibacteriae bacterium]|nr:MAG: hypothetical protein DRQ13_07970 [Ignavibacteriota bacterium]